MAIWKGGPVNNIDELGGGGNIICIGPSESIERFLEIETAEKYFDKEVYSTGSIGWDPSWDEIIDEKNDIREIKIALTLFSKLIPASILNLKLDYPDCDFEIDIDYDGKLSDWWDVRHYKIMPMLANLLEKGKLDGNEEGIMGELHFGKLLKDCVHEELVFNLDPRVITIKQDINILNNGINIGKSFFLSKGDEEGSDINQNCEVTYYLGSIQIGNPNRELKQKFEKTEIYKKYDKLILENWKHINRKRYAEALRSAEEMLNIMPEFYEAWISMKGSNSKFDFVNHSLKTIDFTMKAYVALMDQDKMNKVMMIVKNLHSFLGDKLINIEVIKQNFDHYYNDINLMGKIFDFLKFHPGYLQKNIYKALSFDGKKSAYILEYAEKFGKISRIRHGDSWQLTYLI
jgi:hypothetical protein